VIPQLRIKNWEEFQHYKDRNPPWIKLHRALLDNYDFCKLPDTAKAHLMLIWILGSQNDGIVPHDVEFLERKLSCHDLDLEILIGHGFLIADAASSPIAASEQTAPMSVCLEEKRREEKIQANFSIFWAAYPKKKNKGDAERVFKRLKVNDDLLQAILQAVEVARQSDDWRKSGGQYIPYPASWLNAKGWEDEHGEPPGGEQWE